MVRLKVTRRDGRHVIFDAIDASDNIDEVKLIWLNQYINRYEKVDWIDNVEKAKKRAGVKSIEGEVL